MMGNPSQPIHQPSAQPNPTPSQQIVEEEVGFARQKQMQENDREREHLENVCDSFRQYATFMRFARTGQKARVRALPPSEQKMLPAWMVPDSCEAKERENLMQEAELRNQFFFDSMLRHADLPDSTDFYAQHRRAQRDKEYQGAIGYIGAGGVEWATDDSMEKVQAVLKSLARDWSAQGAVERNMCYPVILEGLKRYLPLPTNSSPPPRLVVPGAGLGRLALEIYSLGYEVQGNEFSLHMLLASDFILNATSASEPLYICPWLSSTRNVFHSLDPIRKIAVPDIDPANVMVSHDNTSSKNPTLPDFSMAAGEFLSIYSKPQERSQWNAVVSCFFLDTAPCILHYLQIIHQVLKDNGLLINFGPLHYHWTGPPLRPDESTYENYLSKRSYLDKRYLESIDISWEDVRQIILNVGFEIVEERLGIQARYTADTRSFMNTDYRCVYFVARKSKKPVDEEGSGQN